MSEPVPHSPSTLEGRAQFVPGYSAMLQMCAQLIAERAGDRADVLILGAGGGLELEVFHGRWPRWRFCAVDPTPNMLAEARERAKACGALDQVDWIDGTIGDVPEKLYDGATCLLTLHFIPTHEKLATLQNLRARLKQGAPFLLVDLCAPKNAPDYERRLSRYHRFATDSAAPSDLADYVVGRVRTVLQTQSPEFNEALLAEAGFIDVELFYAGHSWRGWVAYA
jgi:tRNA (cmo5U34)-methyltransferase